MKVPRIALGVTVIVHHFGGPLDPEEKGAFYDGLIVGIDSKRYQCHIPKLNEDISFTLQAYTPKPSWENFILAINQWDYYSHMSDSPAVISEGKEMSDALKQLFKQLPKDDQHCLQKIVDIVVNV